MVLALALLVGATSRPTAALEFRELTEEEGDAFVRSNEARIVLRSTARAKPKSQPYRDSLYRVSRPLALGHELRPALPRGRVSVCLPRRVAYSGDSPLEPDGVPSV